MRVLYVEDDARDADLASRELAQYAPKITVEVALTLSDARARLAACDKYDLVLADLHLPDGLGLDLLAEIRGQSLPLAVVILTGQGDEATAVAALKAGAEDYLPKREGYLTRLPFVMAAALGRFRAEAARRAEALRVLYAEYHAADIDLTRRHLATHAPHIRLDVVHSSGEVLARLPRTASEDCPWDVVLLDYHLPGLDALELLKTMRDERRLDVPVVLVTGQGDEEVAAQALRLGAADYLVKHANYLYGLPTALENAHHRARLAREQSALRESEARYRDLVENSHDLICTHDLDGNLLSVNEAATRMSGYARDSLLRMNLADLLAPDVRDGLGAVLAEIRATGRAHGIMRVRTVSGESRHWEFDSSLRTEGVEAPLVRGMARDVTERVQAEKELREAQERLQRAVSAGGVGLWDWDIRANQVYFSREWKRQIGYEEHEISNAYDEWRSRVHPDDVERADRITEASLAPPWPEYLSEFRLRHKDGSYRHILARGSVLCDDAGTPIRMLGSHVDITERAQLQDQFLQAQKMESVGRLAGGVAHDFNNLLTVINTSAELALAELKEDDPLREDLEEIQAAGVRAAGLTRQLLAFSRKQVLQPVVLNLSTTVAATEKMLRRLIGEDIDLTLALAENVGSVIADPGQIEQVIVNLAVNARDAMPTGGKLTIETGDVELDDVYANQHAGTHPGSYVMLAISDTGTGMDEATRARIFEPFFTTKEAGRGTGLGLSTVYGIVKQSGGHIWVYSEIGAGTTFKIHLPRVAEAARDVHAVPAQAPARGTETVLVVEDDMALRRAAGRILSSAGYTVLEAADGAEALQVLEGRAGPLHLLLTDVIMPGVSGREVAERLGALRPGLKVLFSSGYADDAILRHGVLDPSVNFIAKPYSAAALTRKVREVLDGP